MESFSEIVRNAAQRSQAFMDGVNANMETALEDLFDSIDLNSDGVISKDEFSGMSLHTWAMFRTLTSCVNCLPNFPAMKQMFHAIPTDLSFQRLQESFPSILPVSVPEMFEGYSWLTIYVLCLFGFHIFLYLLENWRYMAGFRCTWRFTEPEPSRPVGKVDKATALTYDTPLTWYEVIKMGVLTLSGFVVLRAFMVIACFVCGVVCINISTYREHKWWHAFWMFLFQVFNTGLMASMGYMRVNVSGKIADKSDVKVLVGNHCCMIEVLMLYSLSGGCAFLSAIENLHIPLFQGVVQASDALLVDRNGKESKKNTIEEVKRRARNPEGSQLMMFPEGTLNNQLALFQYKSGPFIPGVAVQPVCFRVPYRHFNPCWTGEATGGLSLQDVCWRTLCQFVSRLEVKILPVYHPSEEEQADPILFGNNVRDAMARALDLPVCDASYADYQECQTKYTEALSKFKKDKGQLNFAKARAEMRSQIKATRQLVKGKVKDLKEGGQKISEGPLAYQKAHPQGLQSNYEDSEGGYITREGVTKLVQYKYQGGEYSFVDKLMNPFWLACASHVPHWISPNAVTLTGFVGFMIGLSIMTWDSWGNPEMAATGNIVVQLTVALLIWTYQTMDAIDGKHARNSGQSSPLGALFDHGCDACAMVLGALCLELSVTHPTDHGANHRIPHLLAYVLPMSSFYFAQWEHYHIGILPTAGVTEAQIQVICIVALMGFTRTFIYTRMGDLLPLPQPLERFSHWTVIEVAEANVILFSLRLMASSIRRVVKNSDSVAPLQTLLPFLLHHFQICMLAFSPCYATHRILCLVLIGLNFADLTLRMIISGLCGIKYPFIHWPTVPLTIVSFWVFFASSPEDSSMLRWTAVWQILSIFWLASDTIARICSCLNIPFLAARPQLKKE